VEGAGSGRFDVVPRHGLLDETGLARLSQEQDLVVSSDQLAYLGAGRHVVAHRVASGRWTAVGPRVVVLRTGEPTFRQRLWIATLHSGPASALAGLTAAEADGLRGFATTALHTVVPHGTDAADLLDTDAGVTVRVHQSRRLAEPLVHPARVPRRLLLPEALVDAAAGSVSDDRARLLVIAPVQQRLLLATDLRDVVSRRPRLPRRAVIREAIDDVEGGANSLPERRCARAVRRHRLPEPTRQQAVLRADGTWYLDADFQPYGVGVEINGTQHQLGRAVADDDHRRNVLGTRGRLMITIGSHVVRHRPGVAVVATAAAVMSRGWVPTGAVLHGLRRLAAAEGMDLLTGDVRRAAA
jgi:hypothetical protein